MQEIIPGEVSVEELRQYLTAAISPRPIALVATVSPAGVNNLAPFSFFNIVSIDPPILGIAMLRKIQDLRLTDTYHNLVKSKECTVQVVTSQMVEQVNLAAGEYQSTVDEFCKSGFTPVPSSHVRAPRVKESPVQIECKLHQMIELGTSGGGGNLALLRVVKIHAEKHMCEQAMTPDAMLLIGRNGRNYYSRAYGSAIFSLDKPTGEPNIGYDGLPEEIKRSIVLSANDLAKIASNKALPSEVEVRVFKEKVIKASKITKDDVLESRFWHLENDPGNYMVLFGIAFCLMELHHYHSTIFVEKAAKAAIESGDLSAALKGLCTLILNKEKTT